MTELRGSVALRLALALGWLLSSPGASDGQEREWPEPGTRVRLFAPSFAADTLQGHVFDLSGSAMVLQLASGRRLTVDYGEISLLQTPVYGEYQRSMLLGAAAGAGTLTLLGAAFTGFAGSESTGTAVLTLGTVGAVIGGAIGALAGTRSVRAWRTHFRRTPDRTSPGLKW